MVNSCGRQSLGRREGDLLRATYGLAASASRISSRSRHTVCQALDAARVDGSEPLRSTTPWRTIFSQRSGHVVRPASIIGWMAR